MQNDDPRVGSARDNSTSPGLSRLISGSNSSSLSTLLGTLVPVLIYATVILLCWIFLRHRCPRVYSPRTFLTSLDPHERTPPLPNGFFSWIKPFRELPDTYVLNHSSLDGFFFLRFLKILIVIFAVGWCLTWPILLPLHATGGGGDRELDRLTFGNIVNPAHYYAHAILAWIYFGFVLYMVVRECLFCVNLRQAYLLSPFHAERLSSRTVLFTCVPRQYLYEKKLRNVFGDTVKRIWLPRDTEELEDLVKERDQTAYRLESAESKLIAMANKARDHTLKIHSPQTPWYRRLNKTQTNPDVAVVEVDLKTFTPEVRESLPDVNGSVASQWIPHSSRPHHRPIANYGRRVDTIKWTRKRVKKLRFRIIQERRKLLVRRKDMIPAIFLEFESQKAAQIAYQTLSHHRPLHMSERYIGVRPYEIVWRSLLMSWWTRIVRKFSMRAFVAVLVIFWSIPCAIIGLISNIKYLANKVVFLHWILDLPSAVLGVISGLLPALALSYLMSLVPRIVRFCARVAGTPTLTTIELYVQTAYFIFQLVQVFLVTTLSSAVSAALSQILQNPTSITTLLSQNLPKSSNFYISYILVQSLALGSSGLIHFFPLFQFYILQRISSNPRRIYDRWHSLRRIHWGSIYPVITNLAVITISYSCIAPVILGFSTVGTCFTYFVYRYNILYVYSSEIDTKGLTYPRALSHLLVGLYFAQVCLIGLFALQHAAGPIAMMIALLVFTALVHMSLMDAIGPLMSNLPQTLTTQDEDEDEIPEESYENIEEDLLFSGHETIPVGDDEDEVEHLPASQTQTRGLEGSSNAYKTIKAGLIDIIKSKIDSCNDDSSDNNTTTNNPQPASTIHKYLSIITSYISPTIHTKPNFFLKFLHPEIFADYRILRHMIDLPTSPPSAAPTTSPSTSDAIDIPPDLLRTIYLPPAMTSSAPVLFMPRDPAGVSTQEVKHSSRVIGISDADATLQTLKNGRHRVQVDLSSTRYLSAQKRLERMHI